MNRNYEVTDDPGSDSPPWLFEGRWYVPGDCVLTADRGWLIVGRRTGQFIPRGEVWIRRHQVLTAVLGGWVVIREATGDSDLVVVGK